MRNQLATNAANKKARKLSLFATIINLANKNGYDRWDYLSLVYKMTLLI